MALPVVRVPRALWRTTGVTHGTRAIPEETAVAFTHPHRVQGERAAHVA
jgi:hypothetical protein